VCLPRHGAGELPAVWQQASQADKAQLLLKVLQLAVAWEMRPLMEVLQRQLSEVLTVETASYALMLAEYGRLRVCARTAHEWFP